MQNNHKKVLITGITGQDGSYLAEQLLEKGYEVHGLVRRSSSFNTGRIDHIIDKIHRHYGDVTDPVSVFSVIHDIQPNEVYHLAAQSHVRISFDIPNYTNSTISDGTISILEACRKIKDCKVYYAASSEMYGGATPPQNEQTPMSPQSPYACSKVFGYNLCRVYRESYRMFVCCGILHNHESPRRGGNFVTKKITNAVAKIKLGLQDKLYLGNLDAKRDWGYAPEYTNAMYLMMQKEKPDDYVIATGESHSVKEFCEECFNHVGLNWEDYVEIKQEYFRPLEVYNLIGDASKAKRILGWQPKVDFKELCHLMVDHDLEKLKNV